MPIQRRCQSRDAVVAPRLRQLDFLLHLTQRAVRLADELGRLAEKRALGGMGRRPAKLDDPLLQARVHRLQLRFEQWTLHRKRL